MNVADWLAALGLERYAQAFADNDIDFDVLSDLSEADLERLGVSLGHRKKVLKALEALKSNVRAFRPTGTDPPQGKPSLNDARTALPHNVVAIRSAIEGEHKQVTVLFADLVGSTQFMERKDAEESAILLAPFLETMLAGVRRYQGTVTRVMGDGIVALFGAPAAQEDHAVRACYAALDMQRAIDLVGEAARGDRNETLRARIGLNSGDVVVKSVGDELHMDYDAIGVPVHLASRMEQTAVPGTIQLTARTLALAMGSVKAEALGPMLVKGISEPIEVYRLIGFNSGWSADNDAGMLNHRARRYSAQSVADMLA
jgi:class 3 adenylate cyclase